MRNVVFHYHLFKNAGTSVDSLLRSNFGDGLVSKEFAPLAHGAQLAAVSEWVASEPSASAFSSHTAPLPPPKQPGLTVFPIVFVRHPLDRIASAYEFERRQGIGGFGSTLARNTTFSGYVEVRLSVSWDRQCRNFQTSRLSQMHPASRGSERERAMRALDELPFVGVVEHYGRSIERMGAWLGTTWPEFRVRNERHNTGRDSSATLEERLDAIRRDLGDAYEAVCAANEDDLALFEKAASRYASDAD